jgi:hypothetical protein
VFTLCRAGPLGPGRKVEGVITGTHPHQKEISEFEKFIWIEDPEGRLTELWEK